MKSTSSDGPFRRIAPENLRCIWMSAGLLSYQLCDRQFDCDHCTLDSAMRNSFSTSSHAGGPAPEREAQKENRLENILFSRNHCWVGHAGHQRVRIGLAPRFISLLPPVKSIVLPAADENVTRKHSSFWIVLEGGTLSVASPVTGTVTSRNNAVINDPSILKSILLPDAWLFEVRQQHPDRSPQPLMKRDEAEKIYSSDIEKFKNLVITTLSRDSAEVGLTAADGGELADEVYHMLGPQRYFEIIKKIFHSQY